MVEESWLYVKMTKVVDDIEIAVMVEVMMGVAMSLWQV